MANVRVETVLVRRAVHGPCGIRHYRDGEGISHTHYESVADALELFAEDSLSKSAPPSDAHAPEVRS